MNSVLGKGKNLLLGERDKIITQTKPAKREDDPVDGIIRMAASLVGFASEAHQHRQEKTKIQEAVTPKEDEKSDMSGFVECPDNQVDQAHELLWQHDEANDMVGTLPVKSEGKGDKKLPSKKPRDIAKAFVDKYPQSQAIDAKNKIELPVVLPQRRPNRRGRGFIRAYSPVLAEVGIAQDMFLDFIDDFNKILEPNPWLNAINVVGLAANAIPDVLISTLIGLALDSATDAAMEASSRGQSNTFLNYINRDFFLPCGLIAFVAIWDSEAVEQDRMATNVDYSEHTGGILSTGDYGQTLKDVMNRKRTAGDVKEDFQRQIDCSLKPATGTFDWLDPAPLIFPSAKETATVLRVNKDGKPKNAFDRGEIWLDSFMDRRSQAKWNEKYPNAPGVSLMPQHEFSSRYADPNHAASTGDPVAFLTGGKWSLINKTKLKEEKKAHDKRLKSEQKADREKEKARKKFIKEEKKAQEGQAREEKISTEEEERSWQQEKKDGGEVLKKGMDESQRTLIVLSRVADTKDLIDNYAKSREASEQADNEMRHTPQVSHRDTGSPTTPLQEVALAQSEIVTINEAENLNNMEKTGNANTAGRQVSDSKSQNSNEALEKKKKSPGIISGLLKKVNLSQWGVILCQHAESRLECTVSCHCQRAPWLARLRPYKGTDMMQSSQFSFAG